MEVVSDDTNFLLVLHHAYTPLNNFLRSSNQETNVRKTIWDEQKDDFITEDENGHKDHMKLHIDAAIWGLGWILIKMRLRHLSCRCPMVSAAQSG